MDDSNVAIRLKGFIDSQGLSHSQFADECGIPRPSLSQILSGRNKKISDVIVGQIHKAYPALSILWLLFGEGPMLAGSTPSDVSGSVNKSEGGFDSLQNVAGGAVDTDISSSGLSSDDAFSGFEDDADQLFSFLDEDDAVNGEAAAMNPGIFGSGSFAAAKNPSVDSKLTGRQSNENQQANLRALKMRLAALKRTENELVEYKNKVADLQTQIENLRKNPRKVSHITVYYDDSTFETFVPQS